MKEYYRLALLVGGMSALAFGCSDSDQDAEPGTGVEAGGDSSVDPLDGTSQEADGLTPARCGNGVQEEGEVCDLPSAGTVSCASVLGNQYTGQATCQSNCLGFDTSQCQQVSEACGNGIIDDGEVCDRAMTEPVSCASVLGQWYTGDTSCKSDCSGYDEGPCTLKAGCGNGVLEAGDNPLQYEKPTDEECDDGNQQGGDGCSDDCRVEVYWSCKEDGAKKSQCKKTLPLMSWHGPKNRMLEEDTGDKSYKVYYRKLAETGMNYSLSQVGTDSQEKILKALQGYPMKSLVSADIKSFEYDRDKITFAKYTANQADHIRTLKNYRGVGGFYIGDEPWPAPTWDCEYDDPDVPPSPGSPAWAGYLECIYNTRTYGAWGRGFLNSVLNEVRDKHRGTEGNRFLDATQFMYTNGYPTMSDPSGPDPRPWEEWYFYPFRRDLNDVVSFVSFDHYPIVIKIKDLHPRDDTAVGDDRFRNIKFGKTFVTGKRFIRDYWYLNLDQASRSSCMQGMDKVYHKPGDGPIACKPFWAFACIASYNDTAGAESSRGVHPVPTEEDLRLQVYSNLVYGAQGIQYFAPFLGYIPTDTFKENVGSDILTVFMNPMENADTQEWNIETTVRDDLLLLLKKMNSEFQSYADIFLGATDFSVVHNSVFGLSIPKETERYTKSFLNNTPFLDMSCVTSTGSTAFSPGCDIVVSKFTNGAYKYLAVVSRNVALYKHVDPGKVDPYQSDANRIKKAETKKVELTFSAKIAEDELHYYKRQTDEREEPGSLLGKAYSTTLTKHAVPQEGRVRKVQLSAEEGDIIVLGWKNAP